MAVRTLLCLFLVAGLAGCGKTPVPEQAAASRPRVRLLLNWFPETEHGGYFAAQTHGYYADEGLDVEILPGGPGAQVVPRITRGGLEFGIDGADHVLVGRARGAPVVAVMAPLQVSPRCIMVHQETGIERLDGLRDLTLAMNLTGAFSLYLRKAVPLTNVKIVPYAGNVSQFLLDQRYAQQAYVFSEPFTAQQSGARTRNLLLSEIGFNPYTSVLLTSETMIERQRDTVRRMVHATVRGWAKYLAEPEATNACIRALNPEMDPEVLAYGAETLRPLVLPPGAEHTPIGTMTLERWRTLKEQLVEIGMIQAEEVDPERAFTTGFLPLEEPAPLGS